jgi:TRAP-type uncharacterized transport system fused permease subunit
VLLFATIPTLLYYLGIILAIEMDSRRYATHGVDVDTSRWAGCCSATATTSARSS